MSNIHEECGIFGIYSPTATDVAKYCYYALYALQHRGQESCGIVVNNQGLMRSHKDSGLVNDVFTREALSALGEGKIAVGHVNYGTTGINARQNAQPLTVNHVKGLMALSHNGSLTNSYELREALELNGSIFHTNSDSEVIAYSIVRERLSSSSIEEAVAKAMYSLKGAYSLVIMSATKLIAARDPFGFRPLCIGKLDDMYIFASESCALDSIGATFIRDLEPGEIVIADKDGLRFDKRHVGTCPKSTCVFEYIYFARPDSVIDGSSVHAARKRAGAFLAKEHPVEADVVIGVPDSGIDAAIGYSEESGIPYGLGFIKNKYIGRTFIQPTQEDREDKVKIKLNPVSSTVKGKRVVLVDDSIVRGTTCARIINLLREAGATEVHMRCSAPAFRHPCYFGTVDSGDKLVAHNRTEDEIRDIIGVDSLGYLSTEGAQKIAENTCGFCTGCFTGVYPTEPPKFNTKSKFERSIMEGDKK